MGQSQQKARSYHGGDGHAYRSRERAARERVEQSIGKLSKRTHAYDAEVGEILLDYQRDHLSHKPPLTTRGKPHHGASISSSTQVPRDYSDSESSPDYPHVERHKRGHHHHSHGVSPPPWASPLRNRKKKVHHRPPGWDLPPDIRKVYADHNQRIYQARLQAYYQTAQLYPYHYPGMVQHPHQPPRFANCFYNPRSGIPFGARPNYHTQPGERAQRVHPNPFHLVNGYHPQSPPHYQTPIPNGYGTPQHHRLMSPHVNGYIAPKMGLHGGRQPFNHMLTGRPQSPVMIVPPSKTNPQDTRSHSPPHRHVSRKEAYQAQKESKPVTNSRHEEDEWSVGERTYEHSLPPHYSHASGEETYSSSSDGGEGPPPPPPPPPLLTERNRGQQRLVRQPSFGYCRTINSMSLPVKVDHLYSSNNGEVFFGPSNLQSNGSGVHNHGVHRSEDSRELEVKVWMCWSV